MTDALELTSKQLATVAELFKANHHGAFKERREEIYDLLTRSFGVLEASVIIDNDELRSEALGKLLDMYTRSLDAIIGVNSDLQKAAQQWGTWTVDRPLEISTPRQRMVQAVRNASTKKQTLLLVVNDDEEGTLEVIHDDADRSYLAYFGAYLTRMSLPEETQ